jgi:hypothetical protein
MNKDRRGMQLETRLVCVLVLVLLAGWVGADAGDLGGAWEVTAVWDGAEERLGIETDLTVGFAWTDGEAGCHVAIDEGEWSKVDVEIEAAFGTVDLETKVTCEPAKGRFKDWTIRLERENEPWTVGLVAKLSRSTNWLTFSAEWETDGLDADASLRLRAKSGGCSLRYYDADVEVSFALCDADAAFSLAFNEDGLDEVAFELEELLPPFLPWLELAFGWTAEIGALEVETDVDLAVDVSSCLDLEVEVSVPMDDLYTVEVEELRVDCTIDAWEISLDAILSPADWIEDLYWLEADAEAEIPLGACGEISVAFDGFWTTCRLAYLSSGLSYSPSDDIGLALTMDLDLENGRLDTIGFALGIEW